MPDESSPTPNQSVTLKPCPFCGGEALFVRRYANDYESDTVICSECEVVYDGSGRGRETVASFWNRRAYITRLESEWHENVGPALWWVFPVVEPPYVGTPLDVDWPGYHTHWTSLHIPFHPESSDAGA